MFETLEDMREKSQRPLGRGTALIMYSFDFVLGLFYIISGMRRQQSLSGSRRGRRVPAVFYLVGCDH